MSNGNSFGGKLRKVLASMCSLFVGASGVSQANPPSTSLAELKLGARTGVFGFGDIGWKLVSDDAKKENSWLNVDAKRYQRLFENDELAIDVGFAPVLDSNCVPFCVWYGDSRATVVHVPKGILFDVMRYFEDKYFPDVSVGERVEKLSCNSENLDANVSNEVFLRFILWAFCGSPDTIKSDYDTSFEELKNKIFEFVIELDNPNNTGDEFELREADEKEFAVLSPGYLLANFNKRVHEVYGDLGYDLTNIDKMIDTITRLNEEKARLQEDLRKLNIEKEALAQQINDLNSAQNELQNRYNNLNREKGILNNQFQLLNVDKNDLILAKNDLENQLNSIKTTKASLERQLADLNTVKGNLEKQINDLNAKNKKLKSKKRISNALNILIGLIGGGAVVEGTHRFLDAKRSRGSEVNKDKTSSNEKGKQKAEKNLKKRRS